MKRALAICVLCAACGDETIDPCSGVAGACLAVRLESDTVREVDAVELDVLYGDRHGATITAPGDGALVALPVVTAIALAPTTAIHVGVVAAGKRGAAVLGTGAASLTLAPGAHASLTITLAPVAACVDDGLYCGGGQVAGDADTLYRCDRSGAPEARGRCLAGCLVSPAGTDDTCAAHDDGEPGGCTVGGFYCGGDEVRGDPQSLYVCRADGASFDRACANGCVVEISRDDHCR